MQHKMRNPAAAATANRAQNLIGLSAFDSITDTPDRLSLQAAIIASRYRLTPVMARLVCDLAGIGGRAK